jgi:tetratricopeptide (TPR) repeat protein
VRALTGLAACLRVRDRYIEAWQVLDEAQAIAASAEERALVHFHRGNVSLPLGRAEQCLAEHERALQCAQEAASPVLEAHAASGLGDACYLLGQMRFAVAHFARCLALCRAHGLGRLEVANLAMHGATRFYVLDVAAAIADVRAALALATAVGQKRAEAIALNVLAHLLYYAGEAAEARSIATAGLALARELGSTRFEIKSGLNLGLALIGLGQRAEAEAALEAAVALAERKGLHLWTPWLLGAITLAAATPARRRSARAHAARVLAAGSAGHNHLHYHQLSLEAALREGERTVLEEHARALEHFTRAQPLPWITFVVARGRALLRGARARNGTHTAAELAHLAQVARDAGLREALVGLEEARGSRTTPSKLA